MKHLNITLVTSLLCLMGLSISSTSHAARPVNSNKVGDKQCSLLRTDGSVHKGKCKNVCKDKKIEKDATGQYGSPYKCSASLKPSNSRSRPIFQAPSNINHQRISK